MMQALLVFLSTAAADICWVRFIAAAEARARWAAASWSTLLFALGAVAITGYTSNHRLLVPALAGAFVGTAIGIVGSKGIPASALCRCKACETWGKK
jgi:hypothetical protein